MLDYAMPHRAPESELARAIGPRWSWIPRPVQCTYRLSHGCGLSFEVGAHQAETMSAEDSRTMAGAMAAAVDAMVNGNGMRASILIAVGDGARSCSEIVARTDGNPASIRNLLATLAALGQLRRESRNCYTLPA